MAWVPPDFPEPYSAAGSGGAEAAATTVAVPLYVADDRERLLAELALPCSGDKARWVLAGVALLLSVA